MTLKLQPFKTFHTCLQNLSRAQWKQVSESFTPLNRAIGSLARSVDTQAFYAFATTGEMPAVKLSPQEMEALKGGDEGSDPTIVVCDFGRVFKKRVLTLFPLEKSGPIIEAVNDCFEPAAPSNA